MQPPPPPPISPSQQPPETTSIGAFLMDRLMNRLQIQCLALTATTASYGVKSEGGSRQNKKQSSSLPHIFWDNPQIYPSKSVSVKIA